MTVLPGPSKSASETNQAWNLPSGEGKGVARIFSFRRAKLFGVGESEFGNVECDPPAERRRRSRRALPTWQTFALEATTCALQSRVRGCGTVPEELLASDAPP